MAMILVTNLKRNVASFVICLLGLCTVYLYMVCGTYRMIYTVYGTYRGTYHIRFDKKTCKRKQNQLSKDLFMHIA